MSVNDAICAKPELNIAGTSTEKSYEKTQRKSDQKQSIEWKGNTWKEAEGQRGLLHKDPCS